VDNTPRSTQFKILQNVMNTDSKVKFNIYTTREMESVEYVDSVKTELEMGPSTDPCTLQAAGKHMHARAHDHTHAHTYTICARVDAHTHHRRLGLDKAKQWR
jgi:hypothetical protein